MRRPPVLLAHGVGPLWEGPGALKHLLCSCSSLILTSLCTRGLGSLRIKMPIQMDTKEELLPFILEMLQQRPSRRMLKIYAIGSTLAVLGAIAGLIESVFASEEDEDIAVDLTKTKMEEPEVSPAPRTEVTVLSSSPDETKDDTTLLAENRRSTANRQHAS